MKLVQIVDTDGSRKVGLVDNARSDFLRVLKDTSSTYELAMGAARQGIGLELLVNQKLTEINVDYDQVAAENRLLPPLDHPDPAHFLVSGTGLNHLGSALARNAMHTKADSSESDSMKMFKLGLDGGKPKKEGEVGAQPEWFYKGDGDSIVPPGQHFELPSFSLDGGEEAELVGLYVISESGEVYRVGFALGNEYSDHVLEKQNYLYLAHSKLRDCSIGPELLVGRLPEKITGTVRILRGNEIIWSSNFETGEGNMTHSISNMEYHHFKYKRFRRPGDVHCHFLGASSLSFAQGIKTIQGDVFEISAPEFGRPLRNPIKVEPEKSSFSIRVL
ncbi:MAG: GguC family protein [Thaumarchaeota archaeon]|nr:GguC family protein [Nitrososphaerota archaeon]